MAENLQKKVAFADESMILGLLAEDVAFRQAFLDDPFNALDKYNIGLGDKLRPCLQNIKNYVPVIGDNMSYFNDKLVLCSAAPA